MFNWIVFYTLQYLGPFNFADSCKIELLGIELFVLNSVNLQNVFTNYVFNIYVKIGFDIK